MFDEYRNRNKNTEYLLIKGGCELPPNFQKSDWELVGRNAQVTSEEVEPIRVNGFVIVHRFGTVT